LSAQLVVGRPAYFGRPCKARSITPRRLRGKCRPKCHVARHLFNLTSDGVEGLDRSALDLASGALAWRAPLRSLVRAL
jgi:hypothetical protein